MASLRREFAAPGAVRDTAGCRQVALIALAGWLGVVHTVATGAAATGRTATISFVGAESAGGGVTTFDVDDVTATLHPPAAR